MIDPKERARQLEIIGRLMGRNVTVPSSVVITDEVTTIWKDGEAWKQKPGQKPKLIHKPETIF